MLLTYSLLCPNVFLSSPFSTTFIQCKARLPRLEYLKIAPIICEVGNTVVDLPIVVRMLGRRQISELAEFSTISQQGGSNKRYLPDNDPVWVIRGNTTTDLDYTNYRLNVADNFLLLIFIASWLR
jgi:hypothetical protein